jgi:hypothetical protein
MQASTIRFTDSIIITHHAKLRARQRFGWPEESLSRTARAFYVGLREPQAKGRLRRYFSSVWTTYKKANNVSLHGEGLFVFAGSTLLTVWQLPLELRRLGTLLQRKCA